jgi:murein DD-endopeptidase MepM/ murein hydrolase activator NlpD
MRNRVLGTIEHRLALGAAVLLIGGFASGCSSDTARFSDSLFTGSTYRGDTVVRPPANQPYPGDSIGGNRAVDPAPTGTVAPHSNGGPVYGSNLPPVSGSALPPVAASRPAEPRRVASYEPPATPAMPRADEAPRHSAAPAHGTVITADTGDTVYSLSRRFGVPVRDILAANGMASASALRSGQRIVIPGRHEAAGSHVADVRKVPEPTHGGSKGDRVAMVPQPPRAKEERKAEIPAPAVHAEASADVRSGKYTVQSGDSLYAISKKTGASVAAIQKANGMTGSNVRIGQVLAIPGADGGVKVAEAAKPKVDPVSTGATPPAAKAKVEAADEASPAGYTPPHKADSKVASIEEDDKATAPDSTGISKMRWPVRGRIISGFGSGGSDGDGIDISVPEGTPVKAAENGVVIYAGNGLKEFGNTVLVRHEDGLVTVYGHAKSIEVSRGDKVKRGQEIAQSGMTGNADSPQLHFEVRKNSAPVDPRKYLE